MEALQVRRERDYTDMLLKGLRYPWPAVARRSADAVAKLGRTDLAPQLVALLDEPDPRVARARQEIDDKSALVVRELVRVNHNRNCLLCHSPGNTDGVSADTLRAPIPLPTEPLSPPANGYQSSSPDLAVRIDVTYLREDFSLLQPVEDANPWPEMQRFDFLVRTRAGDGRGGGGVPGEAGQAGAGPPVSLPGRRPERPAGPDGQGRGADRGGVAAGAGPAGVAVMQGGGVRPLFFRLSPSRGRRPKSASPRPRPDALAGYVPTIPLHCGRRREVVRRRRPRDADTGGDPESGLRPRTDSQCQVLAKVPIGAAVGPL